MCTLDFFFSQFFMISSRNFHIFSKFIFKNMQILNVSSRKTTEKRDEPFFLRWFGKSVLRWFYLFSYNSASSCSPYIYMHIAHIYTKKRKIPVTITTLWILRTNLIFLLCGPFQLLETTCSFIKFTNIKTVNTFYFT